jgi:hypothetical protein
MSTTPSTTTEPTATLAGTAIIVSTAFVPSVQSPDEQPETVTLSPKDLAVALSPASQAPSADEAESTKPDANLEQPLNGFVGQLPVFALSAPAEPGKQDEQRCYEYKRSVMRYYGASSIAEYLQGRYLAALQAERAKPGTGKFVADLAQLREAGALLLSNATAYRRISHYKAVREGLVDLLASRSLSQDEKDAWGGVDELTVDAFDAALERRAAGDEGVRNYEGIIEKVKKEHKVLDQEQGGTTTLNLQLFGLTDVEKKRFRSAFNALVEAKGKVSASQYVVDMLCIVAQGGKAVAA